MMQVFVRTPSMVRAGLLHPLTGKAVLRETGVGTFVFTVDGADPMVSRIDDNWGVIVTEDDKILFSGDITQVDTDDGPDGTSTVTYSGETDMRALTRITYPSPTSPPTSQSVANYTDTGPAETVIRRLVNVNAGPGALPERRHRGLTVPATAGTGNTVRVSTRFKPLIEEVQSLARSGGLVVDVIQQGASRALVTRPPRDLSRAVRLTRGSSIRQGQVSSVKTTTKTPTVTAVVLGAQGQGTDRTIREYTTPGVDRFEVFQDRRDTTDTAEMDKTAHQTLEDGNASASAVFDIAETPTKRFGVNYLLGDVVTVEARPGVVFTERVAAAEITWDDHNRTVTLTVGDHAADEDKAPAWVAQIQGLSQRLRRQETT